MNAPHYRIGILGATGMVGQRMLSLLDGHPWFTVTALAASEQSAGKRYADAAAWQLDQPMPAWARDMIVKNCTPDLDCDLVLSGLDNAVAGEIEAAFAAAGYPVISNAKNHRMEADVPLVIPEVNPGHLDVIERQRAARGWKKGLIVTNPNCSTVGLVCALKPLQDSFGLRKALVTTMQAISGAGYPGVASLDILDNVIPFIKGEEEKMQSETLKLLGDYDGAKFVDADLAVSAHCNRVHVRDGHLECVSVELEEQASPEQVIEAWRSFRPEVADLKLPSVPDPFIVYRDEENRPQPRRDREAGRGMTVSVGRLRKCPILHYKFVVLSHNTVRGAAGAAIADAELLA
ncbi:MAG TPA: aspartate-semialdehyde dehydrogenase, partial [Candidatus Eisenbacteria bacterium]|nr:aspartate-semialdehyde dehydrogenase [Candidatus Eisenbacteria bacterium]